MLVYQVLGADAYIEAGECLLEFKPRGGELKDEATKPTALDVANLERVFMLGLVLMGGPHRFTNS